jgi:hypothetical protein
MSSSLGKSQSSRLARRKGDDQRPAPLKVYPTATSPAAFPRQSSDRRSAHVRRLSSAFKESRAAGPTLLSNED